AHRAASCMRRKRQHRTKVNRPKRQLRISELCEAQRLVPASEHSMSCAVLRSCGPMASTRSTAHTLTPIGRDGCNRLHVLMLSNSRDDSPGFFSVSLGVDFRGVDVPMSEYG